MPSTELEKLLKEAIETITGTAPDAIHLESPTDRSHGDLSSNVAMALSKELKKNPRELAEEILKNIPTNDIIAKTEIAGPGFINFLLTDKVYEEAFEELYKLFIQGKLGKLDIGKGKTAISDTSHPNVAKPMGVHHLLSTIIGQSINNLLETAGYKLIKDNYLGDWGTQFGKLIHAIKTWGDMEVIKKDPIPELLKLYVKFHEEAEKDASLEDAGRAEFKKLEEGDANNKELWQWIRDLSYEEFEKIYARLGVSFDMVNGESFYEDKMQSIIDDGQKKGVIVEGEEGALIIHMDDENKPPAIIRKKDGATLYATRDLARIKYWEDELKGDLGVNVVDIAQKLYFEQLFESAEKMGFKKMKHVHVHFGRMSFPEGSMSTRKGNVVLLEDVLDEAEKRALANIEEHKSEIPEDEKKELARIIGIGAIKYNVLSQNRNKNYTFLWDQMLSFDGNSAPYLQYAYTRTQSILRKANESTIDSQPPAPQQAGSTIGAPEEKELLKKLLNFENSIAASLQDYKPNTLCNYLFELAQSFSVFYNNLRILEAETPEAIQTRLQLTKITAYVLKKGLGLLGIEVPERM